MRHTLAAFKMAFLLERRGDRRGRGGCVGRATQAAEGQGVALAFSRYSYKTMHRNFRAGTVCMSPALRVCALDRHESFLVCLLPAAGVNSFPDGSASGGKQSNIYRNSHCQRPRRLLTSDNRKTVIIGRTTAVVQSFPKRRDFYEVMSLDSRVEESFRLICDRIVDELAGVIHGQIYMAIQHMVEDHNQTN